MGDKLFSGCGILIVAIGSVIIVALCTVRILQPEPGPAPRRALPQRTQAVVRTSPAQQSAARQTSARPAAAQPAQRQLTPLEAARIALTNELARMRNAGRQAE
jgi:hypothetical protein